MPRYSWTKHPEIDRLRATIDDARVKVIKHPPYRRLETLEQGTTLNEQHVFTVVHRRITLFDASPFRCQYRHLRPVRGARHGAQADDRPPVRGRRRPRPDHRAARDAGLGPASHHQRHVARPRLRDRPGHWCVALLSDWFPMTSGEIAHVDGGSHAIGA
jgi:hypothetical protein